MWLRGFASFRLECSATNALCSLSPLLPLLRIVDPGTKRKTIWDVAVGALIVFSVAVVPLRLGFDIPATKPWLVIDWITDAVFTVDIIVTFRTAYLDDNNVLVTIPKMIRTRYLKFWFIIDFGSTLPIDKIVESLASGGDGLRSLKLIRIVRLVRLFKLAKLLKIDTSAVEEVIEVDETVKKTVKLFAILFGLAHFFGCFWNMSTNADFDDLGYANISEFGKAGKDEVFDLSDSYIEALYWAFTTMTTVGYGDVLPEEDNGRLYATVMMILGATMFSYIVGSASSIITNEKNGDKQVKEKLLGLYNYCADRGVSKPLEKRLKRNLDYCLNQKSPFEEQYILDCLPSHLRSEVVLSSKKDALEKICIFGKGRNMSFVSCVMQYFQPCQFVNMDVLYHPMVGSRGLYFILKGRIGKVRYQNEGFGASDTSTYVVGLPYEEGEFIGFDAVAVHEDEDRFGAICLESCQCYYLSNEALTLILMRHPAVADTLVQSIKEEGLEMHERRKAKAKKMTKGEMAVMKMENNDNGRVLEALEKEGLAWMSKDAFGKFVAHHSRANPKLHEEVKAANLAADDVVKPFFQSEDGAVHDELKKAGKIKKLVKQTTMKEMESMHDVVKSGSKRDLHKAIKRKSINVSISTNIIDMALKHEHVPGAEGGDFSGRSRMLSGGFVVHPDAHDDDDHDSHAIVQMAITKAARRVTSADPLMGTHSPGSHGLGRSNPFAMKHSTVMRPSGRPEKHGLVNMSKKRTETFLGGIEDKSDKSKRHTEPHSGNSGGSGGGEGGWMIPEKSSMEESGLSAMSSSSSSKDVAPVTEAGDGGDEGGRRSRENSLSRKESFTRRTDSRSRRTSRMNSGLILEGLNLKDIEKEIEQNKPSSPKGEFGGGLVGQQQSPTRGGGVIVCSVTFV